MRGILLILILIFSFSAYSAKRKVVKAKPNKALNRVLADLRISPEIPSNYFKAAQLYGQMGKPYKAAAIYKRLLGNRYIKNQEIRFRASFYLASIYLFKKQFKSAINYYKKAVRLKPFSTPARLNLGTAYLNAKSYHAALGHYQQILTNNPNYAIVYFNVATCYEKLHKPIKARESYQLFLNIIKRDGEQAFKKYTKYITIAKKKLSRKGKKSKVIRTPKVVNLPSKF